MAYREGKRHRGQKLLVRVNSAPLLGVPVWMINLTTLMLAKAVGFSLMVSTSLVITHDVTPFTRACGQSKYRETLSSPRGV